MNIDTIRKNIVGDYGLASSNRYQITIVSSNIGLSQAIGVTGVSSPIAYESNSSATNPGAKLSYLADEVTIPGYNIATGEFKGPVPGINPKYAHTRQFSEANITFMMDHDHLPFKVMHNWGDYMFPTIDAEGTPFYKTRYYDDYCADIIIDKIETGNPELKKQRLTGAQRTTQTSRETSYTVSRIVLFKAFPYVMSGVTLSNGPNQPLKFQTTFYYERMMQGTPSNNRFGVVTNEYYNNFGIDAQDSTNFRNFFNGRRVDQGVLGAEAQA